MPPCLSLRDWHEGGKSRPSGPNVHYLISQPRFLHFTLNHYTPGPGMRYGVQRVCRIFGIARSTVDSFMAREAVPPERRPESRKRGPVGFATDEELVAHTRRVGDSLLSEDRARVPDSKYFVAGAVIYPFPRNRWRSCSSSMTILWVLVPEVVTAAGFVFSTPAPTFPWSPTWLNSRGVLRGFSVFRILLDSGKERRMPFRVILRLDISLRLTPRCHCPALISRAVGRSVSRPTRPRFRPTKPDSGRRFILPLSRGSGRAEGPVVP